MIDKFNRIGGGNRNKNFNSFYHTQSMLSLNNAFNDDDIAEFINKIEILINKNIIKDDINYIIEPKIDGLSLSLHFENGKLIQAGTRGDGLIGEDVTNNIKYMTNIPTNLPLNQYDNIEIRGELYISKQDFIEINKLRVILNLPKFSTTRNAAAGSIRNLDKNISWLNKKLKFYAYNVIFPLEYNNSSSNNNDNDNDNTNDNNNLIKRGINSQFDVLQYLHKIGFESAQPYKLCNNTIDIINLCNELNNLRNHLNFDIDGAVIKVNELKYHNLLGNSSRYPKWAIAKKFTAEEGITILEDIILQVGRTGLITPVALLKPIKIGGVIIEKATLHNFNEIHRLGLYKGAKIKMKRAGDVIPKIIGLVTDDDNNNNDANLLNLDINKNELNNSNKILYEPPSNCPVCNSDISIEGLLHRCTGSLICSAQITEGIRF